ncbi:lysylphosphatidylglycerol synthase transmembrane domain-containing protein [Steroidobacter cummioxidans]|uniref:lysylphosphatidylglycerol synthase transmembrane domain-containing protein n=1 Tax=Steroidobacter cummioxidans TaxID=1803913 RepID=UPI001379F31F|nr:lysylphosphatidylglycerol synthase transmembrane domain-containing protein [Steroidobacter cummioxidans]
MKLHIEPKIRVALQLCASVGLLVFLLSRLDWQRSLVMIRGANPLLLASILMVHAADRVLMALKWHQLLRVLDDRLERRSAIAVYYESTFIGFALPLGGFGPDLVRFVRLRGRGIDSHVTLSSMVMERLNGAIATLAFITVGCVVLARLAPPPGLQHFALISAIVAGVAGLIGATLIFYPALGRALIRLFRLPASIESGRFAKYVEAARAYSRKRLTLAINLGLSMIEQTMPVFTMWIGSHALGAPLPWLVCLAVSPVAVVIQRLPLTYGGLGLREGSAAALLVALGYDYSTALVLLMTLVVMFLISLLPGAIVLATAGRPLPKRASA